MANADSTCCAHDSQDEITPPERIAITADERAALLNGTWLAMRLEGQEWDGEAVDFEDVPDAIALSARANLNGFAGLLREMEAGEEPRAAYRLTVTPWLHERLSSFQAEFDAVAQDCEKRSRRGDEEDDGLAVLYRGHEASIAALIARVGR